MFLQQLPSCVLMRPAHCLTHHAHTVGRSFTLRRPSRRMAAGSCRSQQQDTVFTIVGGGRVGTALEDMASESVMVARGEPMPQVKSGPIVVCTRNDDLDGVVAATPEERRKDLVFIQNGMLQPWLDEKGLGDTTQVLVYFAVAKKGEAPTDGKTDLNPEGLTAAYGPHAETFAHLLHANGLSCSLPAKPDFVAAMLEKLVWICAYMVVGARHKVKVGEVEQQYRDEVELLIKELGAAGAAELGVSWDAKAPERLHAYSRSVAHFPTAVKELRWRNGWFHGLSQRALEEGKPDPCPTHTAWLRELGVV